MINRKGQISAIIGLLAVGIIAGTVLGVVVYGIVEPLVTTSPLDNDTFLGANNTANNTGTATVCMRGNSESIVNNSNNVALDRAGGNYTIDYKTGQITILDHGTDAFAGYLLNINATYADCGYFENGATRAVAEYTPVMLFVSIMVIAAASGMALVK